MSIRLKQNSTVEEVKQALEKLQKTQGKHEGKNVAGHFGKLKRGLDGLAYQNAARNEWDTF
jgi:hypothetical protein